MRKKVSKTEGYLMAMTAALLCVLSGLYLADRPTEPAGTYTVVTERTAPAPVTPEVHYLNINTATAEELVELSGVGEVIAERIVAYRESHGPFTALEQLLEVKGIGPAKLEGMRRDITLDGTPPETAQEEQEETP